MNCPRCNGMVVFQYVVDARQDWLKCISCGHLAPQGGFMTKVTRQDDMISPRVPEIEKLDKQLEAEFAREIRERLQQLGEIYGVSE